jgi:hypothetical protein
MSSTGSPYDNSMQYAAQAAAAGICRPGGVVNVTDPRTSEQVMVDMIRADLGVVIDPQAWRMFIRHRFERISPLAHRIHDGKR